MKQWESASLLQLVQKIQAAKKAQAIWGQADLQDRSIVFQAIKEVLHTDLDLLIQTESFETGIDSKFLKENVYHNLFLWLDREAKSAALVKDDSIQLPFPVGVGAILLPRFFGLRWALQNLLPGLIAGNAIIIKPSSKFPLTALAIESFIAKISSRLPDSVLHVIQGTRDEVGKTLAMHPSIRNIVAIGQGDSIKALAANLDVTKKKVQLFSGSSNSSLVLADDLSSEDWDMLTQTLFLGFGQTGFNSQKIFVLESHQASFEARLKSWIQDQWITLPQACQYLADQHKHFLDSVRSQQGKVFGGQLRTTADGQVQIQPALILDFSHCSEWQQEQLPACAVILSSVKYSHEMAKWSNVGDWGLAAQIWGDAEKANRLATKLNVGVVWINTWIQQDLDFHFGAKSSYVGIPDRQAFGAFWSECRKVVSKI